jgi:hypothetical protein
VAEAGKAEYPIPMFVNAAQDPDLGRARAARANGQSGGPMPDAMDVWRAGAPQIDMLSPDIYDYDFADVRQVHPVREPAVHTRDAGIAAEWRWPRVLYAFGRHDAIGFSPMGIDGRRLPTSS